MLEKIPKTVPIDFGTSHGNELLNFFDTCRRRGIGTDIELTVNGEKLKVHSFILAAYSDVFHEMYFPDFYCKNGKTMNVLSMNQTENTGSSPLVEFEKEESTSLLQIINWMYTGKLHLHNQTLYTIMKLSKKFQIQVLVSKIKKIDEENITLADLPSTKTYSNTECQYEAPEYKSVATNMTGSDFPMTGSEMQIDEPAVENQSNQPNSSSQNPPAPKPILNESPLGESINFRNHSKTTSDDNLSNQVSSSTRDNPSIGSALPTTSQCLVSSSTTTTTTPKSTNQIQPVKPTTAVETAPVPIQQTQTVPDPIIENDHPRIIEPNSSSNSISTRSDFEPVSPVISSQQEQQANIYLNESHDDPMIGCSADQSEKREDRLISVPNGFKCLVCRRILPTEAEGLKHVKSSHSKTYNCTQCGRVFNNKANMKRHALIKHSGEIDKKFQCGICGRRYAIKQSLRYHLETKHDQKMIDNDCDGGDELKKIDEECISNNHDEHCHDEHGHKHPTNSLTGLEEALEELKRYEDDESIEYRTCHNPIPNPEPQNQPSVEPPIHTVDPLSAYFNPVPPMQPAQQTTVQTSIQGHANTVYTIATSPEESSRSQEDAPMLTTLIPAVKTTPISMHSVGTLQSRVIALNQENYHANMVASSSNNGVTMETNSSQCDYCKLFFSSPVELTKHKKRKRCNRHRCQHCQRAFAQLGNLRRHIQILHSGAKPYKCKMCSKAYGIRQSLRYHMQNTHGIRDLAIDQNKNQLQAISSFQYP